MKNLLNKLIKSEGGQILPTVLVVLLAGVLIMVPTLAVASTSISSGKFFKDESLQLYAADAGIEKGVAILETTYPEPPPIPEGGYPSFILNGNTTNIIKIEEINDTKPPTFEIVSNATDSSGNRNTTITAWVQLDNILLDSALVGLELIDIGPGTKVDGNVVTATEYVDESEPIDNKGTITGTTLYGQTVPWPEPEDLIGYYWDEIAFNPYDSPYLTTPPAFGQQLDIKNIDPKEIGAGYRSGALKIWNSDNKNVYTVTLQSSNNGTAIYIKGNYDLQIGQGSGQERMILDLNKKAIFSEGSITINSCCTVKGSGCIIALGDVYFSPKIMTEPDDSYILVMSVNGTVKFQPTGNFHGTVAGKFDATLQPLNTLNYTNPFDIDWGEGNFMPFPYWLGKLNYRLWIVD